MIGLLLVTVLAGCPEDCSKVLVAKAKEPVIHEQIIKKEAKVQGVVLEKKPCVEWNGECQEVDERSGFYSIITSKDVE